MNVEPIIKARFNRFREAFDLKDMADGVAFERFVNHAILTGHQPDAFGADPELLDQICVGGSNDMGIDGIAIKLNGLTDGHRPSMPHSANGNKGLTPVVNNRNDKPINDCP